MDMSSTTTSFSLLLLVCLFGVILTSPQGTSPATRSPFAKSPTEQPCSRNEDCATLFPNSWCKNGRTCECTKEHVEYEGRCIPVIPINGDESTTPHCEADVQCAAKLSRCNEDTKKCECFDRNSGGRNATAFWRNVCYIKTGLGQSCDINEQCKASVSPPEDVECDVRTRTCKCRDGKTCEDVTGASPHLSSLPSLTLFLSGFIAFKVFL